MKHLLFVPLLLFTIHLDAQTINGVVTDIDTANPISNVLVFTKSATTTTNEQGKFSLHNIKQGDHISFRILGYQTQEVIVQTVMINAVMIVKLKTQSFDLKAVGIKAPRNFKKDSLALRKEFAAVFSYKKPDFTDMFIKVDPGYRSPFANINPNSTASLLKFNALSAFKLFSKKSKSTAKFKSALLKVEENNFIAQSFSKEKVAAVTKLTGDSLLNFMNVYRPSILVSRKMSDYELTLYIKKCYADFTKKTSRMANR